MKLLNLACLFFSSVAILACSEGGESNPVSDNSRENFVGFKYPLVLDEVNRKFSTYEVHSYDVCKVDDDKYEFVTMVDTQHIDRVYDFRGDTLVIFYSDNSLSGDAEDLRQIFLSQFSTLPELLDIILHYHHKFLHRTLRLHRKNPAGEI